jgi:hypothetical protein
LGNASKSPQLITIYSPPTASPSGTNNFVVTGQTFMLPVATDLRLCRASGFFKDPAGRPLAGLDLEFINQFDPTIVDGFGVMSSKIDARTDVNGYVEIDFYRNGIYQAMVESIEAPTSSDEGAIIFERKIVVPDRPSININDLLFPVVKSIAWNPDPISLAVGDTLDILTTVISSDYQTLIGTANEDILYSTEDESIAVVTALIDKLVLAGVKVGATNLIAVRKDQSVVVIPWTGITGSPILVTVT